MTRIVTAATVIGFFLSLALVFGLSLYARALRNALADCQRSGVQGGQAMSFSDPQKVQLSRSESVIEGRCGDQPHILVSPMRQIQHG